VRSQARFCLPVGLSLIAALVAIPQPAAAAGRSVEARTAPLEVAATGAAWTSYSSTTTIFSPDPVRDRQRSEGPDYIPPPPADCEPSIGLPSGSYNINTGVLNAFVVGDVACNFVTTSLFETINFEGSTAGQKINNAGSSNSCDKCSSLPNVEAKYSAVAPCGAASYQHYL
jgi:hypothetical protein